jgi:hypothetical protein
LSTAGVAPNAAAESGRPGADAAPRGGARGDARTITEVGVAHAVSHYFQLSMQPRYPALRADFASSWSGPGLPMTVFCAVSRGGQAAVGSVVDAHGPRRVLAVSFALLVARPVSG